jgi:hypothetical protein
VQQHADAGADETEANKINKEIADVESPLDAPSCILIQVHHRPDSEARD